MILEERGSILTTTLEEMIRKGLEKTRTCEEIVLRSSAANWLNAHTRFKSRLTASSGAIKRKMGRSRMNRVTGDHTGPQGSPSSNGKWGVRERKRLRSEGLTASARGVSAPRGG